MEAVPSLHSPVTKLEQKALRCLLVELGQSPGKKRRSGRSLGLQYGKPKNLIEDSLINVIPNTDTCRTKIYDRKRLPAPRHRSQFAIPFKTVKTTHTAQQLRKAKHLFDGLERKQYEIGIRKQFEKQVLNSSLGHLEEILSISNLFDTQTSSSSCVDVNVLVGTPYSSQPTIGFNGLRAMFAAARESAVPLVDSNEAIEEVEPYTPQKMIKKKQHYQVRLKKQFDPTASMSYEEAGKLFKWTPVVDLELEYFRNRMARRIQALYRQYLAKQRCCARWGDHIPSIVVTLHYLSRNRSPGLLCLLRAHKPTAVERALVISLNYARLIARVFTAYRARSRVYNKLLQRIRREQRLATRIQSRWRGCQGREVAMQRRTHRCIILLQRVGKSFKVRLRLQKNHIFYKAIGKPWEGLTTMLQSTGSLSCLNLLFLLPTFSRSIGVIQRIASGYLSRFRISRLSFQQKASAIQIVWRTYRQRMDFLSREKYKKASYVAPSLSLVLGYFTANVPGLLLTGDVVVQYSKNVSVLQRIAAGYLSRLQVAAEIRRPGYGLAIVSFSFYNKLIQINEEEELSKTKLQKIIKIQNNIRRIPSYSSDSLHALVVSFAEDDPAEILMKVFAVKQIQKMCRSGIGRRTLFFNTIVKPGAGQVINLALRCYIAKSKVEELLSHKRLIENNLKTTSLDQQRYYAALFIQCQIRRYFARIKFIEKLSKQSAIQRQQHRLAEREELYYCETLNREEIDSDFVKDCFQFRRMQSKAEIDIHSAAVIQTCWRGYACRQAFKNRLQIDNSLRKQTISQECYRYTSALTIQRIVRGYFIKKRFQSRTVPLHLQLVGSLGSPSILFTASVSTGSTLGALELIARGSSHRFVGLCAQLLSDCAGQKMQKTLAVSVVQYFWRRCIARKKLLKKREFYNTSASLEERKSTSQEQSHAASTIKRIVEGMIARERTSIIRYGYLPGVHSLRECLHHIKSATIISSTWRMYRTRLQFTLTLRNTKVIQRIGRACISGIGIAVCRREQWLKMNRVLQRTGRGYFERKKIQKSKSEQTNSIEDQQLSIIKIQSHWRGHLTRKKESDRLGSEIECLLASCRVASPKTLNLQIAEELQSEYQSSLNLINSDELGCVESIRLQFLSYKPLGRILHQNSVVDTKLNKSAIKIQSSFRGSRVRNQINNTLDDDITSMLAVLNSRAR